MVDYSYGPLVTVEELSDYMGDPDWGDLDDETNPIVRDVKASIAGLQSQLEMYLNRPVQPVLVRESAMVDNGGVLNLTISPVQRVVSLREIGYGGGLSISMGETVVKFPLTQVSEEVRTADKWGEINTQAMPVPGGLLVGNVGFWYVVEYIGGYTGYWDEGIKQGIKQAAARTATHNHDDTINFTDDDAKEAAPRDKRERGWTKAELAGFDRLRRRTIV